MDKVSIIGYATIMDPENARKIGLERTPDAVWINSYQRFFGFPDSNLEGRTANQVFDTNGVLLLSSIGATTVQPSEIHRFNAVIYNQVPGNILAELDRIEESSHLVRLSLGHEAIRFFRNDSQWYNEDNPVFVYVAKKEIIVPGRGTLQMLRTDITPHAGYLAKCRAAASVQGDAFRAAYEDTTFLADRARSLRNSGL